MGTQSAPNIIIPIIDYASGSLDSNLNVKLLKYGGTLGTPADEYELTEIGSSGRYALSTAVGADAIPQDIYSVYVDSGGSYQLRGIYLHGGDMIKDHILRTDNPHGVIASQVTITDTGSYYTGANVDAVLQEIGSTLNTKADINNTLLLNDTAQSVVSAKPKITNFDADKVDGKHANDAPSNLMILDGDGLVPLEKIPDSLTGKDASTVAGKAPGNGNNNLAIISDNQSAGRLDTSLLGEKKADLIDRTNHTGTQLASTISDFDAEVSNNTDVANNTSKVSADGSVTTHSDVTSAGSGQIITNAERTALGGGGTIWSEIRVTDETEHILDNSIDWRDRFVSLTGAIRVDPVSNFLPGEENDQYLHGDTVNDSINCLFIGFMYSGTGCAGAGWQQTPHMRYSFAPYGYDYVYVWVDNAGRLCCGKETNENGTRYTMAMKIEYSSDQGHYS